MRVRVSDEHDVAAFIAFVRAHAFRARKRSRTLVEIAPLVALGERTDRGRVVRLIDDWQAETPGARAELVPEDPRA